MLDFDGWQEIWHTLRTNKLRTFLTACGVFWGILMLVVMLGMGGALERGVQGNMGGFATNSVYIWGQRTSKPYKGLQPGRRITYETEDIEAIRRHVPEIEYLAPRNQLGGWRGGNNVTRGAKTGAFTVTGDYPEFRFIQPMRWQSGRFINDLDIRDARKVAVIGDRVIEFLFEPGEEPLGQSIEINGVYFTVVGTFRARQTGEQGEEQGSTIFVPLTSFQKAFNTPRVGWFAITAKPQYSASVVEDKVIGVLKERHRIHPDDDRGIGHFNAEKEFGKMSSLFGGIRLIVWVVGVVTLLAGVIGVSNIMLIVVRERTKEIGVRKAVGATPMSITLQLLQEATFLTAVAGYFGLVAGVGILELVGGFTGSEGSILAKPTIDLDVAITATLILVVSGAVAGLIPARMAVRVNTVEALRAE